MFVAILRIYDQLTFGKEFVGDEYRLIHIPARIAAKVEYEFGHTLAAPTLQSLHKLRMRRAGKLRQADEGYVGCHHEGRLDTLYWDGVAHDRHVDQILYAAPLERELHLRAAGAAQTLDYVVLRHLHARHQRVVNLDYAVARRKARLGARAVGDDAQHQDRIGRGVERDAYAVELALQRLVHGLHLPCGYIYRVGIELLHHERYDQLRKRIHRDRIDELVLDQGTRLHDLVCGLQAAAAHQRPQLRLGTVAAHKLAEQYAEDDTCRKDKREEYRMFRVSIHLAFNKYVLSSVCRSKIRAAASPPQLFVPRHEPRYAPRTATSAGS